FADRGRRRRAPRSLVRDVGGGKFAREAGRRVAHRRRLSGDRRMMTRRSEAGRGTVSDWIQQDFRRVHFVGIGGAGMSGIAEVLHNLGYDVSGSDKADSAVTQRLAKLGIQIHKDHRAENVADVDALVVSGAIKPENPELIAARE